MHPTIVITPAASAYIKKKLQQEHSSGFRLSIKKTGCSGYSYHPSVVAAVPKNDLRVLTDAGFTIFIDPAWLHILQNIHIDYVEEQKSGLKQKRLIFTNPQESSRCGCGESFHFDAPLNAWEE